MCALKSRSVSAGIAPNTFTAEPSPPHTHLKTDQVPFVKTAFVSSENICFLRELET